MCMYMYSKTLTDVPHANTQSCFLQGRLYESVVLFFPSPVFRAEFKLLRSSTIDSKESILASLRGMAGRYDKPIPTRFLAPHRLL
jgi:hypothetical protein